MPATFPKSSKRQIDKAGKTLIDLSASDAEVDDAYNKIADWRAAHAFPSQRLRALLSRNAKKYDQNALVVSRLKRIRSIFLKLEREPYRLSQFQDIAGMRATVERIDQVEAIARRLTECRSNSDLISIDDYVAKPRMTGYRSVHMIWRFQSPTYPELNGILCEMQIRTALQNAWATAVEMTGFYKGEQFKNGVGDQDWLRLFQLVSAINSHLEHRPVVAGFDGTYAELNEEARDLIEKLNAIDWLHGYRASVNPKHPVVKDINASWYLLMLNSKDKVTNYEAFGHDSFQRANVRYKEEELKAKENPHYQVALVSAFQLAEMRQAYPSFFSDATSFMIQLEVIRNPNITLEEIMQR